MRIVGAIAIASVVVLAVSFFSDGKTADTKSAPQKNFSVGTADAVAEDSDNDGLKDWEEALFGTDPKNKDTDSDGTPDGEETRGGRNPLVAGPDDASDITGSPFGFGGNASSSPISKTDAFAREVFSAIAAQKGESGFINPEDIAQVSTSFAEVIAGREKIAYTGRDVSTTENSNETVFRAYGNAVSALLLKAESNIGQGEMAVIVQALQNNNEAELKKLGSISDIYAELVQELLLVSVPKTALYAHLALINSIADIAQSVDDMQQLMSDPLAGMAAFGTYRTSAEKMAFSLTALRSVLGAVSIVFTSKEPGRIFNR